MLFCMPSMRVPCSPKYFSAIRCFPFNKCKDDLFIGWGHAEGTVPHGLQSATWRVSDHCYQPWRRQLSPSHSGNKSSFQMFWRFELGLNYKIWIWIGKWTVSWLISIIVTCSLKYLLSDLNCCIKKKKLCQPLHVSSINSFLCTLDSCYAHADLYLFWLKCHIT